MVNIMDSPEDAEFLSLLERGVAIDTLSTKKQLKVLQHIIDQLEVTDALRQPLQSLFHQMRAVDLLITRLPANIFYISKTGDFSLINHTLQDKMAQRVSQDNLMRFDEETMAELKRNNHQVLSEPGPHIFIEKDYQGDEDYISVKRRIVSTEGIVQGLIGASIPYTQALREHKDYLLQSVFHDIRGPLSGMYGLVEDLLAQGSESNQEELSTLHSCMQHYMTFINQCLQQQDGESATNVDVCHLSVLMEDMITLYTPNARIKNNELRLLSDVAKEAWYKLPVVSLKRIIGYLLSNAIKFTEYGYVWLACEVVATEKRHELRFCVEDTGLGIAAEDIPHIFKKYFRARAIPGQYAGSGLGLYNSAQLLKHLGGDMEVTSTVGKGSCFTVTLAIEAITKPTIEPTVMSLDAHSLQSPGRLLLVEDDALVMRAMKAIVAKVWPEARVDAAHDYQQAIAAVKQQRYDLLLLDLGLPDVEGPEYIQQIKSQVGKAATIAVISGQVNRRVEKLCIQYGADAVYTKPLLPASMTRLRQAYNHKVKTAG